MISPRMHRSRCTLLEPAARRAGPRIGGRRSNSDTRFDAQRSIARATGQKSASSDQLDRPKGEVDLNDGIATFYDNSTGLWEDMWGDHLHHGYYPLDESSGKRKPVSNQQAQIDMIDNVLEWANVREVKNMLDVGCGLGGSSRHVADIYPDASATGITLSPYQAKRGNEISKSKGLGERVRLQVADALYQPFDDASFDLVWSLESGEHMPDKQQFVSELYRVTEKNGRVIIVTWCHRVLEEGEESLREEEERLLARINEAYFLPKWCSVARYKELFEEVGFKDIKTDDWSQEVSPFWGQVIRSALSVQGVMGLFRAGYGTLKGALVMPLMAKGLRDGTIKFVLITGVKK
jgi:tocopherol O-methyltransferase